jgi:hypothetical protein
MHAYLDLHPILIPYLDYISNQCLNVSAGIDTRNRARANRDSIFNDDAQRISDGRLTKNVK